MTVDYPPGATLGKGLEVHGGKPFLSLRLLSAASWASWFAIQWCRVFEVGDQALLMKMFWAHLVCAVITSFVTYVIEGVAQMKDE